MKDSNSGVNTILLVLVLIVAVIGVMWMVQGNLQTEGNDNGANIEVQLPSGDGEGTENQ